MEADGIKSQEYKDI